MTFAPSSLIWLLPRDPEWWVSREKRRSGAGVWWKQFVDLTRLILRASANDLAPSSPIWLPQRFRVVSVYRKRCKGAGVWWKQTVGRTWLILSASASDLAPSARIWLPPTDPEWWVSRGRDAKVRVCDGSRLLIVPGWSWAHLPVISLLQHLCSWMLNPESWVSRGRDAKVRVCDGSRLLVVPGWSWAHQPVISLLQHLCSWMLNPESWVSRGRDAKVRVCGGSSLLISPGWSWDRIGQWSRSFITYLVASNIQCGECLEEEMQRCGCVMEADCWSYLVDLNRISQCFHSFITYPVALKLHRGECLEEVMEPSVCDGRRLLVAPGWSWAHLLVISLLQHLSGCLLYSDWWVSRRRDAAVRMCGGSSLLISPGWSWAHRPMTSLL